MKKYLIEGKSEIDRLAFQNKIDVYNIENEFSKFSWKDNDRVLDAGCGSGNLIELMVRSNINTIHGIDMSEDRIDFCRNRFKDSESVQFFTGTLDDTKLSENYYDKVICRYVFEHITNPIDILMELFSITKEGGQFYIINFDDVFFNFYTKNEVFNESLKNLKNKLPQDFQIGRKLPQYLAQCGFVNVDWEAESYYFKDEQLELEKINTKMRLDQAKPLMKSLFNSEHDFDNFAQMYLEEMNDPNNILSMNKFIIKAQKPPLGKLLKIK